MIGRWFNLRYGLLAAPLVFGAAVLWAQDTLPPLPAQPAPLPGQPASVGQPMSPGQPTPLTTAPGPAQDPNAQNGVEVLTRGPVHEAFASLAGEPEPTQSVVKKPPEPIEEMPPAEKPEGEVHWIKGYWAWDDDRKDYLWVSGVWRTAPPGKDWMPGYWREDGDKWQWTPGFWTAAAKESGKQDVTYLPKPPAPPEVAPPAQPQQPDTFYVPGQWVWNGERYVWQPGYWAKVQPGYVWVAAHYRWSPTGYVYIPGYWDLAVSRRGLMYAPVVIRPEVVRVGFVYTPTMAVHETIVVDTLWVRPCRCHYYFGDYYGPEYRTMGYESCVVYSQRHYDCIIVYERWDHRREPDWFDVRVRVYNDRWAHPEMRPPRTLVEVRLAERRGGPKFEIVAEPRRVMEARGAKVVVIDNHARMEAKQHAEAVHAAAVHRTEVERKLPQGAPAKPHVATVAVPPKPVSKPVSTPTPNTTTHNVTPPSTGTAKPVGTPPSTSTTHPVSTPPSTGLAKPVGTPPSTGLSQPGTHTTDASGKPTTQPTSKPSLLPANQKTPPPKDKDKDKDKDKSDRSH